MKKKEGANENESSQNEEKSVNVRFPNHVHARLKELARREGRSLNAEVVSVLIERLRKEGYDMDFVDDRGDDEGKPSNAAGA